MGCGLSTKNVVDPESQPTKQPIEEEEKGREKGKAPSVTSTTTASTTTEDKNFFQKQHLTTEQWEKLFKERQESFERYCEENKEELEKMTVSTAAGHVFESLKIEETMEETTAGAERMTKEQLQETVKSILHDDVSWHPRYIALCTVVSVVDEVVSRLLGNDRKEQ